MKRHFLLLTFLFSCLSIFAQRTGDATFYSNTGKKFYVVLNGIRQNTDAQNNVNVSGLTESFYSCRIIAADKSFNLEKNIVVKKDSLVTYRIIEKKGKYKLRYYTESPLGTAPAAQDQVNVVYHDSDLPQTTTTGSNNGNSSGNGNGTLNTGTTNTSGNVNTNTSTTTTTTSTSTNQGGNGENLSININMNENGMGIDIQGTGMSKGDGSGGGNGGGNGDGTGPGNGLGTSGAVINSTSTETTTTSTSTTTTINGTTTHSEASTTVTNTNNNGVTTNFEETSTGSEGNLYTDDDMVMTMDAGCGTSDQDMQQITAQISGENFPEDKLRVAKMFAQEKCMSVDQIKSITNLLAFDDEKMAFIKLAYTNCMNQSDFHQLMSVFAFSDDKEELEKFIQSK